MQQLSRNQNTYCTNNAKNSCKRLLQQLTLTNDIIMKAKCMPGSRNIDFYTDNTGLPAKDQAICREIYHANKNSLKLHLFRLLFLL
jgi:hypothetical protein